jgi:hypothetical protein
MTRRLRIPSPKTRVVAGGVDVVEPQAAGQALGHVAEPAAHRGLLERDDVRAKRGDLLGDQIHPALELLTVTGESRPGAAVQHVQAEHGERGPPVGSQRGSAGHAREVGE